MQVSKTQPRTNWNGEDFNGRGNFVSAEGANF